jgi:ubiquinone/menaquinone biosynthesis C-methylase UbiE
MNHSHDRLIHWARAYDLANGLFGRRGRGLREAFADDLGLHAGDRVLDVGCGTGQLAMTFAGDGTTGSVAGVDAAAEMIERATSGAQTAGSGRLRWLSRSDSLPNATFDAVACTLACTTSPKMINSPLCKRCIGCSSRMADC